MTIDVKLKDGKGGANHVAVDKFNSVAVHETIPALPPQGTRNRHQFYRAVVEDMNVNGATTNQVFTVSALQDADFYITRIVIVIGDSKVKEEKYGDISALSNGVDIISHEGVDTAYIAQDVPTYGEFFYQTGGEVADPKIKATGFEVGVIKIEIDRFVPGGIRLGQGTTDRIEFVVKDNLTGLVQHDMYCIGYKHVE